MGKQVLIIEDEKDLADILAAYLRVEGFECVVANDGEEGLKLFRKTNPDLILLDIMLPKVDGIQVCKEVRGEDDIPIIMISAKSGEMDKVVALGIGADDYVTKPFSPLELVARVKAQLRRYEKAFTKVVKVVGEQIEIENLVLNKSSYSVSINDNYIAFTTKEFDILYFLASSPKQVFSKEQIYEGVWGYDGVCDDNSVTVYINRIRDKLTKQGQNCIHTVWGVGYKFSFL